jgi:iron complex transport system substrate-binding protein
VAGTVPLGTAAIAAALALTVTACSRPTPVAVAAAPRVISLHDVTTEIVVALGALDRLVGVAGPVDQPADVVAATAKIPAAAGTESIIALRPSVVLGMAVVQKQTPDLVRLLRERSVNVVLGDPHTLADVVALVETVAEAVGLPAAGAALASRLRTRSRAIDAPVRPARAPLRIFVYDCCDPAFTAGGRAVLSDLVRRAGGQNVFADLDVSWSKVPWEQVVARRPQLIIINDYDFSGQGDAAGKRAQLRLIPSLARVPTTVMPLGESLGGIRSVDGLERLARAIAGQAG